MSSKSGAGALKSQTGGVSATISLLARVWQNASMPRVVRQPFAQRHLRMTARFFRPPPIVAGAEIALPSDAAHHARQVLRLRVGDTVTLFDGEGGEYGAQIARVTPKVVSVRVIERHAVERESPLQITLVQSLVAADRMDYAIQKAVELGAVAIVPVASAR